MPSAGDRMRAPVQRGVRASRAVKRNGQSAVQGLLGPRKCHCSKGLGDGCQRLPGNRSTGPWRGSAARGATAGSAPGSSCVREFESALRAHAPRPSLQSPVLAPAGGAQWHSVKHRWLAAKQGAIQSAVWGSAGLRFLHFLLGRRDRRCGA